MRLSKLWVYDDGGENYPYELKLPGGYSLAVGQSGRRLWYWRVLDERGMPLLIYTTHDLPITCQTAARAAAEAFARGMGVAI